MASHFIVALRHGEKPYNYDGAEMSGLSCEGERRATLLADALLPGQLLPRDAAPPSRMLVPDYGKATKSHRTWLTVAPLAARVGIDPTALGKKDDVGGLVDAVLAGSDGTTVICWEHDCLVAWLHRLAGRVTIAGATGAWLPCDWRATRFDVLWLLAHNGDDANPRYTFTSVDQKLLPSDKAT